MKSRLLCLLAIMITAPFAFTQAYYIDRSGKAILLRDQQNAAIFIQGEASLLIRSFIKETTPSSQVSCGENHCEIGQMDRKGSFSRFSGTFARTDYFDEQFKAIAHPTNDSDKLAIERFLSDAYAAPTQCQDANGQTRKTLMISLEGLTAERLFNYILKSATKSPRSMATEKSGSKNYFFCERIPVWESADYPDGFIPKNIPPSYQEYRCVFELDQQGRLVPRPECQIYGGAISAGGGSRN